MHRTIRCGGRTKCTSCAAHCAFTSRLSGHRVCVFPRGGLVSRRVLQYQTYGALSLNLLLLTVFQSFHKCRCSLVSVQSDTCINRRGCEKQIYRTKSNPRLQLSLTVEKGHEGFAERQKFNLVQYFLERGLFLKERRLRTRRMAMQRLRVGWFYGRGVNEVVPAQR